MEGLIRLALLVLTMLVVVPVFTGNAVSVPKGGFFRGLFAVLGVCLLNWGLWWVIALFTVGTSLVANWLLLGLVALLVNALAFSLTAKIAPSVLYVRDYGSAVWAALIMTIASWVVHGLHF